MTIKIDGITQSLIDAVASVTKQPDHTPEYRDNAIAAIKKNVEQGAITPEVGAEQLKAWVMDEIARPKLPRVDLMNTEQFDEFAATVNELSKHTLGNYSKKAISDVAIKAAVGGRPDAKSVKKTYKRVVGVNRAVSRLTGQSKPGWVPGMKEDTIDEAKEWKSGDRVKLHPDYADRDANEIFTVGGSDSSGRKVWIGDKQGRGWYAHHSQLISARSKVGVKPGNVVRKGVVDEAKKEIHPMGLHVTFNDSKTYGKGEPKHSHFQKGYKVVAVGKKVRGIKVGEQLSDTELDDATELGHKIKHVNEGFSKDIPYKEWHGADHKVGDEVFVHKDLSDEDQNHIGKVSKVSGKEVRVKLPDGHITAFHHEVYPVKRMTMESLDEMRGTFRAGSKAYFNAGQRASKNIRAAAVDRLKRDKENGCTCTDILRYSSSCPMHGVKKESLADTGTSETVVEARNRELGHLLLKKVKDMKPKDIQRAKDMLKNKKPAVRVEDVEADQNILVHLRKTIDTDGKHETLFADGETAIIPEEVAQSIFEHLMKLKPEPRGEVQMYMQESFENVLEVYALLEALKRPRTS